MDTLEPKKLALIRILQILKRYSDINHPLTQEDIANYLERDYKIILERKAISRNISLLKEAGFEIESSRSGCYLEEREFEDAELRMLIDGVLSSKHITAKHSKDLIEKLCDMSNIYFRSHIKNVYSVNDWSKTDNQALFYNIEIIDEAIEQGKRIKFDYNRYGTDKKLYRTSTHRVSPYQLILHNQRYYLMALNEMWHNMAYYRLDRITNMTISDKPLTPIHSVDGYESGINYKEISTALPYMYTDKPQEVEMIADIGVVDQIVDWFGNEVEIENLDEKRIKVKIKVSLLAMEYWAMQYLNVVEITKPLELRQKLKDNLDNAVKKYSL